MKAAETWVNSAEENIGQFQSCKLNFFHTPKNCIGNILLYRIVQDEIGQRKMSQKSCE